MNRWIVFVVLVLAGAFVGGCGKPKIKPFEIDVRRAAALDANVPVQVHVVGVNAGLKPDWAAISVSDYFFGTKHAMQNEPYVKKLTLAPGQSEITISDEDPIWKSEWLPKGVTELYILSSWPYQAPGEPDPRKRSFPIDATMNKERVIRVSVTDQGLRPESGPIVR